MPTRPEPPAGRARFFRARRFSGRFRIGTREFEISVQTPDLREAPTRFWADWGPMYTCELDPEERVTVAYRCPRTDRSATYRFSPPTLAVNSPARASVRRVTPFCLQLEDMARGLRILAYLDAEGEVACVDAHPIAPAIDPVPLILRGVRPETANDPHPAAHAARS